MEQHSKITQRHPSTGANPSEQTAENAQKGVKQDNVWRIDELLYKLVENNVAYAGEQFGENLKVNNEVLTNVLYDNIRKLLGDKFDADDFTTYIADELLKNGYVLKSNVSPSSQKASSPKGVDESVDVIDPKDYQELLDKIRSAVALLEANKDTISKRLSSLDEGINDLGK